uniref:RING-type domain-containing protein n=1 Tax=Alexandrium monilatum TaxID=311494 RepID=A0A7S4Q368_9DINO
MGAGFSDDGLSQAQQQQRAQLLLLSQLREARAQEGGVATGPGVRPTEQPGLRRTQVYKNPLHVHSRSVQLERRPPAREGGHERWDLVFTFDATVPCEVVLSLGAAEDTQTWPPPAATWSSHAVGFEDGLGQVCRQEVDYESLITPLRLAGACDGGSSAPFVTFCLELKAKASVDDDRLPGGAKPAVEWTVGRLTQRLGGCAAPEVDVRGQNVHLPGMGMAANYEMREVFGVEAAGPAVLGQDCVICMSEMRDTAVLPCRHMCLCGGCAETMRSRVQYRSYRCPICRERVASLLQISQAEATEAPSAEQMAAGQMPAASAPVPPTPPLVTT